MIYIIIKRIFNFFISLFQKKEVVPPAIEPPVVPDVYPPEETPTMLEKWALAIRTMEGWYAGSVSQRHNNPGNIKSLDGTFLIFEDYQEGWEYLLDYLTRAATGKHKAYNSEMTLLEFFGVYAPANDKNNPYSYTKFVAKKMGVLQNIKIKELV